MVLKYLDYPFRVLVCVFALGVSSVAYSASISNVYIFGDSLSDTGAGLSDGVLWPVYFSPQVGTTYNAANNYSVAGARTVNLASQVSAYQADNPTADPDALYVVWAGANDIGAGLGAADAANNLINTISTLSAFGAENFLVPNLPDLGFVPSYVNAGLSTFGTNESILFNSTIDSAYSASTNVLIADIFGFHHDVLTEPSAFGLTNATDSCLSAGADCSTYLYWDNLHPTTAGHSLISDVFVSTVSTVSAVPVPAVVWLFSSGLLCLVGMARRRNV